MVTAIVSFPNFYRAGKSSFEKELIINNADHADVRNQTGGWTALGGTHFSFYREIPMFSNYEIRTNVACWDEKWVSASNSLDSPTSSTGVNGTTDSFTLSIAS